MVGKFLALRDERCAKVATNQLCTRLAYLICDKLLPHRILLTGRIFREYLTLLTLRIRYYIVKLEQKFKMWYILPLITELNSFNEKLVVDVLYETAVWLYFNCTILADFLVTCSKKFW